MILKPRGRSAITSFATALVLGRVLALAQSADKAEPAVGGAKAPNLRFVSIPAGSFKMGCSPGDKQCEANEKPGHAVRISKPYQLMATKVTAKMFREWALGAGFVPRDQPAWSSDDVPVVMVTWADAQAFCSAFGGRLPTEAEWEYAARAGGDDARYAPVDEAAWYADNSGKDRIDSTVIFASDGSHYYGRVTGNGDRGHPVALKKPNAIGLFDTLGDTWEWTSDWLDDKYYERKIENDPTGPNSGQLRVTRGGSWLDEPVTLRASRRNGANPQRPDSTLGFRCARDPGAPVTLASSPDLKRAGTLTPPGELTGDWIGTLEARRAGECMAGESPEEASNVEKGTVRVRLRAEADGTFTASEHRPVGDPAIDAAQWTGTLSNYLAVSAVAVSNVTCRGEKSEIRTQLHGQVSTSPSGLTLEMHGRLDICPNMGCAFVLLYQLQKQP